VKDIKRDAPIAFLFAIAISLMFVILKLRGITVISSILINTILFWIAVKIDHTNNGSAVILIFSILAVILLFCHIVAGHGVEQENAWSRCSAVLCATAANHSHYLACLWNHSRKKGFTMSQCNT